MVDVVTVLNRGSATRCALVWHRSNITTYIWQWPILITPARTTAMVEKNVWLERANSWPIFYGTLVDVNNT